MKKLMVLGLILFAASYAMAQPGWNWPEEVDLAKEKNALYSDMVKSKNFEGAAEPHAWLLEKCPDLNKSLYINGIKIYEALANAASDPEKKSEYQAMTMKMYDDRIKYFGEEPYVVNRKAYKGYKFYKSNKGKYEEMIGVMDRAFELNGNDVMVNNLAAYMDFVRRYKATGGDISDERIIDIYTQITDIIDYKKSTGKQVALLDKILGSVDKMLTSVIDVDCDFIEDKLVPKMRETKDPKMAKKVFQLMLTGKCSDSPSFLEAAEMVNEVDPAYGLAKVIAQKYGQSGDMGKAKMYYDKALELTDDNIKKAEIFYSIATMQAGAKQFVEARKNARKALANDPSMKDAYTLIGNMYMQSYEKCREGISKVDDRLCFIAAFNQYKKAGNTKQMASAKAQFPSIDEIFELGLSEGQSMTVGCWINETVVLERRPN